MNALTVTSSRRLSTLVDGLPRVFWALLLGTFITRAGTFVMPLLFVYLTQVRRLGLTAAGAITSLYGLGSLLGGLIGGAMADRYGRRATILWSLTTGAAVLLLLSTAERLSVLAPLVFLTALASEAYRPAGQAVTADVVPASHRVKAFTIQYWAINLGFALSSVIGGFMATRNFQVLFVADALSTLVLAAIVWKAVPETKPEMAPRPVSASWFTPFVDRAFLPFLVLNFATVLMFFLHLSVLPDDMAHKGLHTEAYGLAISTNGVLIVLLQPFVPKLIAGRAPTSVLAVSALLVGAGFALNVFAHDLLTFSCSVAVWTLGEIVMAPVSATLVATLSPVDARGRYQAAFGLTWALGMTVAPVVGSTLISTVGHRGVWLGCLGLGAIVALGHLSWSRRSLSSARPG